MQKLKRETPCGLLEVWIPDDPHISFRRQISDGAVYEPATVEAMAEAIDDGAHVYDCGARWGYFSRLATLCGAEVVAYEKGGRNCLPVLEKNAEGQPINIVQTKIGPKTRAAFDYAPDVVKIDVEGDERNVFGFLIREDAIPDTIIIEMHPAKIEDKGGSQEMLLTALELSGYDLVFTDSHRDENYEWVPLADNAVPTGMTDYLLVGRLAPDVP